MDTRGVEMRAEHSGLFLVKSAGTRMRKKRLTFRTGEKILQSGIYRVVHRKHRLPHEVTLVRDQSFPRCAKCQDGVQFQLIRGVRMLEDEHEFSTRICLYELPVLG
jgi:hypothetical protein